MKMLRESLPFLWHINVLKDLYNILCMSSCSSIRRSARKFKSQNAESKERDVKMRYNDIFSFY